MLCKIPDISICNLMSSSRNFFNTPLVSEIFSSISEMRLSKSDFLSSCSAASTSTLDFSASSIRTGISACFFFHSESIFWNFERISSTDGAFSNSLINGKNLSSVFASSTSEKSSTSFIKIFLWSFHFIELKYCGFVSILNISSLFASPATYSLKSASLFG